METFVSHLESPIDGTRFEFGRVQTTHEERPLLVSYDLKRIKKKAKRGELAMRSPDMWRYKELLPVGGTVVSLGEVMTPTLHCPRLGARLGLKSLFIKDESRLPTGSFKARGMAVAITMAVGLGQGKVALASAGNAGGAAAAYCARAGIQCFVLMPFDTPEVNVREAALFGARVSLVEGTLADCARVVRAGVERMGWYDLSTMREPYRLEGKKTMGFELAEQFGWGLPDAIFYPTGGGTGLLGMWKAFQELAHVGWLGENRAPRMYACQASGCAPLVRAFERGEKHAVPPAKPHTVAAGLCVPSALADFLILESVRASKGLALDAPDEELLHWMREASSLEGIGICPETAVCFAALERAVREGHVKPDERVVVFNTGAAQKYVEALRTGDVPRLAPANVDWSTFT